MQQEVIQNFRGMCADDYLPYEQGLVHTIINGFIDNGRVVPRGGIAHRYSITSSSSYVPIHSIVYDDDKILVFLWDKDSLTLRLVSITLGSTDSQTIVYGHNFPAGYEGYPIISTFKDGTYIYYSYDHSTSTGFWKWDMTTNPLSIPTSVIGGLIPSHVDKMIIYDQRPFLVDNDNPNRIVWGDDIIDWTDFSDSTNYNFLGDTSSSIVGLAVLQSYLVVLKTDSIYLISGQDETGYVEQLLTDGIGCSGAFAVTSNILFFIGSDGKFYRYDGAITEIPSYNVLNGRRTAIYWNEPIMFATNFFKVENEDMGIVYKMIPFGTKIYFCNMRDSIEYSYYNNYLRKNGIFDLIVYDILTNSFTMIQPCVTNGMPVISDIAKFMGVPYFITNNCRLNIFNINDEYYDNDFGEYGVDSVYNYAGTSIVSQNVTLLVCTRMLATNNHFRKRFRSLVLNCEFDSLAVTQETDKINLISPVNRKVYNDARKNYTVTALSTVGAARYGYNLKLNSPVGRYLRLYIRYSSRQAKNIDALILNYDILNDTNIEYTVTMTD